MTGGTVHDIRTGRAIGRTRNLSETFTRHVQTLLEGDMEFYIVYGRCQHRDVRETITFLKELDAIEVILDKKMPPDTVWIFEGLPDELGFVANG